MAPNRDNEYLTTSRHRSGFSWVTVVIAAALILAGVFYSTGMWSPQSTPTQSVERVPDRPITPSVPNAKDGG